MMSPVCAINPNRPQPDIIDAAAAVIKKNGVVIMPTYGLYGLGGDAFQTSAVKRIFKIKNRILEKPLLVLISHQGMLQHIVTDIPPMATHLMDAFWPGRVTLVMKGCKGLPDELYSNTGKVGVRMVAHPVAAALVKAVGRPITGTSANLSGSCGCSDIRAIENEVAASVDMVLDAGTLTGGPGSSVIDVTGKTPVILRQGCVTTSAIMNAFDGFITY